jgi:cytochrome c oxidase subunit I
MKSYSRGLLGFVIGAVAGYLLGIFLEWLMIGTINWITPVTFLSTTLFALIALSYFSGWYSALTSGLVWQIAATFLGAGLVTGIRALMGLSLTDTFFFTEPAWVLGGFVGAIAFLFGSGVTSDWMKWARGIDTPEHHEEHYSGWEKYINVSLDHKVIGIQYTLVALALIGIGGTFAMIFRTELAASKLQFLTTDLNLFGQNGLQLFNSLISLHGIVMIISILLGISGIINYVVPLLLGAQDMSFPRLNAFSFWVAVPGALLLLSSLVLGGFDTGWTGYPPLSSRAPVGVQMFFMGVFVSGWS